MNEAAQALAKPAPKVGLSASELADRLGSVKRVIKPRSSMPDLKNTKQPDPADDERGYEG